MYSTAQLILDRTCVCNIGSTQHVFFILHTCKHACACKIDDIKPIVQSSHVYTRCVHSGLQMYVCMSGTHMPNLDCVHFSVHENCKPRTMV